MLTAAKKRKTASGEEHSSFRAHIADEERVFARVPRAVADGLELPAAAARVLPDGATVAYGWMTPAAWKHAHANLRFELVRTQNVFVRQPGRWAGRLPAGVERIDRFDEQARWVYDRCADGWGAAVVRDDAFLNARFVDGAARAYTALGVRDGEGLLRGYAVLSTGAHRRVGADHRAFGAGGSPRRSRARRAVHVADWLVPFGEKDAAELLHAGVMAHARAERADLVLQVVPEWSRWAGRLQEQGWILEPTDRLVAVRSTVPKHDMEWLRDHWWYQLAESHLV